jgi:hypothetical protein
MNDKHKKKDAHELLDEALKNFDNVTILAWDNGEPAWNEHRGYEPVLEKTVVKGGENGSD